MQLLKSEFSYNKHNQNGLLPSTYAIFSFR